MISQKKWQLYLCRSCSVAPFPPQFCGNEVLEFPFISSCRVVACVCQGEDEQDLNRRPSASGGACRSNTKPPTTNMATTFQCSLVLGFECVMGEGSARPSGRKGFDPLPGAQFQEGVWGSDWDSPTATTGWGSRPPPRIFVKQGSEPMGTRAVTQIPWVVGGC